MIISRNKKVEKRTQELKKRIIGSERNIKRKKFVFFVLRYFPSFPPSELYTEKIKIKWKKEEFILFTLFIHHHHHLACFFEFSSVLCCLMTLQLYELVYFILISPALVLFVWVWSKVLFLFNSILIYFITLYSTLNNMEVDSLLPARDYSK